MLNIKTVFAVLLIGGVSHNSIAEENLPKFVENREVLTGLNSEELEKVLGTPHEKMKGGCTVPVGPNRTAVGTAWGYSTQTSNKVSSLQLCLIKGKVAAHTRKEMSIKDGLAKRTVEEHLSMKVISELLGTPTRDEQKEPDLSI